MQGGMQGLLLAVTVAVIFVNGWTDAPNAITSAVSTGALPYRRAVWLAAVCNLGGIGVMGVLSASVADTMLSVARFPGAAGAQVLAALCASMLSIVLFAVAAWFFGIPTSESHALIAALSGASLALGAGWGDAAAWGKVAQGLVVSVLLGAALGWLLARGLAAPLRRCGAASLRRFQVAAARGMAFMHGAQDGQKFIAVLIMADRLARGVGHTGAVNLREHPLALLLCAAVMALGTSVGGRRIVEKVGGEMVSLRAEQGVCADLAGALCLLAASLSGVPMSTSHTKTTAMLGAGAAGGRGGVRLPVLGQILLAWVVTFPVCGALAWGLTRLLLGFC